MLTPRQPISTRSHPSHLHHPKPSQSLQQPNYVDRCCMSTLLSEIKMALRSWSEFPLSNPNFILTVLALLTTFFLYTYEFVLRLGRELILPWLVVTAIAYALCLWSFIAVVATDPGSVPLYWGVYDRQNRERKYCLVCHNFKPDRSHHCSKCRKCVLNMDHHCPWINNCVGFHNRKHFLLFLFYLLLTLALCLPQMVYLLATEITDIVGDLHSFSLHTALCILVVAVCLMLLVSIGYFFLLHVGMALSNVTTIEQLLAQRKKKANEQDRRLFTEPQNNQFDISPWYNFTQVFGENMFYWPIPVLDEIPRGRGLYWDRNNENLYCETAHNSRKE